MDIDQIKSLMQDRGIRQVDVAKLLGIEKNKVSLSLSGKRRFTVQEMDAIRAALADTHEAVAPQIRTLPIIGQVTAGNWRQAIENPIGAMPSPDPHVPPRCFVLEVEGNSMDEIVAEGGTVIVDPDDRALYPKRLYVVENGQGDTTFKQFESAPARLVPRSSDSSHTAIVIGDDADFTIIGRVIWSANRH